jgi:nucleotide-binding universal stress UspA family protein
MEGTGRQTIVVGMSGSPASEAALRWAADEARRRQAVLRVVRSWNPPFRAAYAPHATTLGADPAGDELAAVLRAAFGPRMPAEVSAELVQGLPERVLVEESAGADLLVIGSAAVSLTSGVMGPVIRACLCCASCPVVVVHAGQASATDPPSRAALAAT